MLARVLGAEAFGFLAMAAAFVILTEFLVRESLTEYLITTKRLTTGHLDAAFWLLIGPGAILSGALFILSGFVAAFYDRSFVQELMRALSSTVFLVAFGAVPVAILQRDLRFRSLPLRAVAGVATGGIVAIWMALHGNGVWSLVVQRIVQILTNTVLAWLAVSWRPGFRSVKQDFTNILGFGSSVLGLRATEVARIQVPMIIIGSTLGPTTLGLFLIMTPLRMVSQSAFATLKRQGSDPGDLLLDISRISSLLAFPVFFGLAILSEPVLEMMFGTKWLDAAPILSIIAFVGIYLSIEMVHQSFCLAAGRAKAIAIISWIDVVLGAALVWAVSGLGITSMSAAFLASFLILWVIRFRIVSGIAHLQTSSLLSNHVAPLAGACVMILGVIITRDLFSDLPSIPVFAISVSTGAAIFFGFTVLFMRDRIALLRSFTRASNETQS